MSVVSKSYQHWDDVPCMGSDVFESINDIQIMLNEFPKDTTNLKTTNY